MAKAELPETNASHPNTSYLRKSSLFVAPFFIEAV